DDRLLAMVLLRAGWEETYEERPPVHPIAVVGRVFNEQQLPDGRYNLLLHGLRRVRIVEELPPNKLYREARVQLLADVPPTSAAEEQQLRSRVRELLPQLLEEQSGAEDQVRQLLDNEEMTLGTLCDVFAFALPLEVGFKQQLLEELDVGRRTRALVDQLEA